MLTLLITLILGTICGLLLAISALWVFKIKCPQCKQLKPLKEIFVFHWKTRKITGKLCQKCQNRPGKEIDL